MPSLVYTSKSDVKKRRGKFFSNDIFVFGVGTFQGPANERKKKKANKLSSLMAFARFVYTTFVQLTFPVTLHVQGLKVFYRTVRLYNEDSFL